MQKKIEKIAYELVPGKEVGTWVVEGLNMKTAEAHLTLFFGVDAKAQAE